MNEGYFRGKRITVMGLGLHGGGIGSVKFLADQGAIVTVTDLKSAAELADSLEKLKNIPNVKYALGGHGDEDFLKADMVLKNPGISWKNKYVQLALENNVSVEIDSSLFFKLCKNRIIGVTGTRGKTTTASLVYEILKEAGLNPIKVGVGQISVLDKLKELQDDSVVVFELSSWRLSALGRYGLSPNIAVITNIFQDHLNYYSTLNEYIDDKKYIFSHQKKEDVCVINHDDERLKNLQEEIISQIVRFSRNKINQKNSVYISEGSIYSRKDGLDNKIMEVSEIKIKGTHNISNVLASIGVAQALNIGVEKIKRGIRSFAGLPHRLEFVRELDGVKYYNDTTATSPDGAISGINSFSEPIILIAGGSDKNLDMKKLAEVIQSRARKTIFLEGAGTDKIIKELSKKDDDYIVTDSMASAVNLARNEAIAGDVVLLSPGTASFGLFLNEFDRGEKFKLAVSGLK